MTARLNGQMLPEGWVWTQMDFVCQKVQDGTHFSPQVQYEQAGLERYLYVTAKNVRYGRLDLSNVTYIDRDEHESIIERCNPEEGDVLLTKDGVNTGIAAINHLAEPFSLLSSVALLKPYREILNSKFLMHYLHSPLGSEMITGQMTGTAIKRIILRRIKEAPICIAPLNEQRRIVEVIETQFTRLDAAVTALKRSQANLKRYRAAVLKAACEGRLVPTEAELAQAEGRYYEPAAVLLERILAERRRKWEAENPKKKYQEPVAPDTSALPELPKGWVWSSLGHAFSVFVGATPSRKLQEYWNGNIHWVSSGEVV
jgi:type I restriction enzyme S subunit